MKCAALTLTGDMNGRPTMPSPAWLVTLLAEHRPDSRPGLITPGGNQVCMCGELLGPGSAHVAEVVWAAFKDHWDEAMSTSVEDPDFVLPWNEPDA